MRNWRTGYWLLAIVPVSSSDSAGYWQCPRGPCRLRAAAAVFVHPFPLDTRSSDAGGQMNACYADVGITGIMPTPRSCRLLTRDPRRSCLRPAEIRHNQRLFKQATAGRRADVGPVSLQQVQQCCDFANGQKVRKQRVSRERLTDTRHFARPLPSSVLERKSVV